MVGSTAARRFTERQICQEFRPVMRRPQYDLRRAGLSAPTADRGMALLFAPKAIFKLLLSRPARIGPQERRQSEDNSVT
jgi:hypothetical protein